MKKLLLFGSVLFATLSAFPQNNWVRSNTANVLDMRKLKSQQYSIGGQEPTLTSPLQGPGQNYLPPVLKAASASTINWQLLCGSMNVYGMLVSNSRPLQYHPALNTVSFVHRKSTSYQPIPLVPSTAESGVIVAEISSNWGNSWDSTALWSNATQWGRYPQGAIYNPPGNTSINDAYVVGSGPTVSGSNFTGNWYASKKLGSYDNTASIVPGAQQFLSFTLTSYPANQSQHGWSRTGFSSTDDGVVRSLAIIEDNLQELSTVRGFAVVTGTFNGATFDWSVDSLIPNCIPDASGQKHLNPDPQMAWNQAGTVGYVVGIGALSTSSLCNKGYQPIVYKLDRTTNPAATWLLMKGIDFNSPCLKPLTYHCAQQPVTQPAVNGDTIGIPFVNDYDITVDANNNLHIGMTFMSTATDHSDSLNFISQFTTSINPTELYKWPHVSGGHPYLYDFVGNGSDPWVAYLIDSISSEGPGVTPGSPGFNDNPWDNTGDGGIKIGMDSRIQLGRTPDGKFITYSWVESDSAYTFNAFKWNNLPDIQTRLMAIGSSANTASINANSKINVSMNSNDVRTRASLHFMSPTTGTATSLTGISGSSSYTVNINTPFTVTNSNPYSQLTNNSTWFGRATLSYLFYHNKVVKPCDITGIHEINGNISGVHIYPNPTKNSATLSVILRESSSLSISFMNTLGQTIKVVDTMGNYGENKIDLHLSDLSSGIYFVNIKADNSSATNKLIIE